MWGNNRSERRNPKVWQWIFFHFKSYDNPLFSSRLRHFSPCLKWCCTMPPVSIIALFLMCYKLLWHNYPPLFHNSKDNAWKKGHACASHSSLMEGNQDKIHHLWTSTECRVLVILKPMTFSQNNMRRKYCKYSVNSEVQLQVVQIYNPTEIQGSKTLKSFSRTTANETSVQWASLDCLFVLWLLCLNGRT